MHTSLDQALGRNPRLSRVGQSLLNIASGASAAYSLRSLTGGDPKAVRVRRSTGGEEDFTVSEVASGQLKTYVTEDVSSILNSAYYFAGDVHSHVTLDSDITLQDGESMSLKYFWGGTTSGVEVLLDFGGPTTNAILIKTNGELRVRINAESIDVGTTLVSNAIDTLTISRSGNTVTFTTGSGSNAVAFTSGALRFQELGGTSGQTMNGVFYDWNIGSRHSYTGLGATAWEDTIGSNDGTPSNLVSFTGQEVNGFVSKWYDQSGSSNDAAQTSADLQPRIVKDGSLEEDNSGNIAVKFDGTDDYLVKADASPELFGPYTFFTHSDRDGDNGNLFSITGDADLSARYFSIYQNADSSQFNPRSNTSQTVSQTGLTGTNVRLTTVNTTSDTSYSVGTNGAAFTTGTTSYGTLPADPDGCPRIIIGKLRQGATSGGQIFGGFITEIIAYAGTTNGDQSGNRTAVETNMANYYGITLS